MVSAPAKPEGHEEPKRWLMELQDVSETLLHDVIIELLKLILKCRFKEQNVLIASNLACRWDPTDHQVGVDPDVIVVEPAPPEGEALKALQVWLPEHNPPKLAIEVVSETNADKDYGEGPPEWNGWVRKSCGFSTLYGTDPPPLEDRLSYRSGEEAPATDHH